jgi:predicted nucleic-acid-binding Zn-ribbon protein
MAGDKTCPKCGRAMSQGFIVDNTYGGATVSSWQSGKPVRSIWTGVKQDPVSQHEVASFRCNSCGFLEHYAL